MKDAPKVQAARDRADEYITERLQEADERGDVLMRGGRMPNPRVLQKQVFKAPKDLAKKMISPMPTVVICTMDKVVLRRKLRKAVMKKDRREKLKMTWVLMVAVPVWNLNKVPSARWMNNQKYLKSLKRPDKDWST